jgi:hypothetical protein
LAHDETRTMATSSILLASYIVSVHAGEPWHGAIPPTRVPKNLNLLLGDRVIRADTIT